MAVHSIDQIEEERRESGRLYREFLRVPALSAGLYVLAAGAPDPQQPHDEDEIYYVTAGKGVIRIGENDHPIEPGVVIYVPAQVEHRFHSIREELSLLVIFAPAESRP